MTDSISVIVPVYRSQAILPDLARQLISALEPLDAPFEIIFVEDCGGDGSWEVIKGLANRDPRMRGLKLSRNFGQQNATLCGIRAAKHDVVVTMDDDLQHPPQQIQLLLMRLAEGHDVVYGVPERDRHGLLRALASRLTKIALQSAMGAETARNVSAFRAFRTPLRTAFDDYRSPSVSVDVLLSWATRDFSAVRVTHQPRRIGKSSYTIAKLVNHAFNMVTGFSTLPLRIASILGFLFTLFGLGVLAWVLGMYLVYGAEAPGFVFLATIITIFSGVQLFALGIIGEYVGRIFSRTMEKPAYMISEEVITLEADCEDRTPVLELEH